jgi:hypothetical protein
MGKANPEKSGTIRKFRILVLAKYPAAFGWRQFSVSDYTVHTGTGRELASAHYAKDAWRLAAEKIARTSTAGHKGKTHG